MEENEFELVVVPGKRHIAERALAAVFFTCMFICLYRVISPFFEFGFSEKVCLYAAKGIKGVCFCFAGGVSFSMTKTVMIDTDRDKLVSRYCIGTFSRDRISAVPQLEYIAVFLNKKDDYEVNLWYKGNKHYPMYCFEKQSEAMAFAQKACQRLKLDLLDKSVKGESNWIAYQEN